MTAHELFPRDARGAADEGAPGLHGVQLDGVELVGFTSLVERIAAAYPGVDRAEVSSAALREYEAFTGGVPLAVPMALAAGLHELFGPASREEDVA